MTFPVQSPEQDPERVLRPSLLARLNECIHYRPDGKAGDSLYVQRGNRIDDYVRRLLKDEPIGSWKLEEAGEVAAAEWIAGEAKRLLERIEVQRRLQLWDMFVTPHELVFEGVCDISGWNKEDEVLEVWDVKSGRERDYQLQLMAYALMLMDATGEVECRTRIAYVDSKILEEQLYSRGQCEKAIFSLVERIRINVELPEENEYCGQCARQSVCPVWVVPAEEALTIINADMSPLLEPGLSVQNRLELLKQDPQMLGKFIDCWRKAATLVEKSGIEDHAKELLLAGKDLPGWRLSEVQGRKFYDKEQITAILAEWGESAGDFLSVNTERYRGACENSDTDFIEASGRNPNYYKLIRKR